MTTTWQIRYRVIPAGIGPDDYEHHELEARTDLFEFPVPGPDDPHGVKSGTETRGPAMGFVQTTVDETLPEGAHAAIMDMQRIDEATVQD